MVVQLAILTYPTMFFLLLTRSTAVRMSIRPLIGVNNVKPMFGGSLK
jgi:hypothetical protein